MAPFWALRAAKERPIRLAQRLSRQSLEWEFSEVREYRVPGSLETLDREGWKEFTRPFMTGFSERELVVESVIAEGDEVAARVNFHGRHTGDFQGTPPTGREIKFTGTAWFRIADGKVVEHWGEFDGMSLMQQLGVGPSPEGTQG